MSEDIGRELDWDDPIEKEGTDFVLLPEGDYDFEIIKFERARHEGSDKLPPCKKAIVHVKIEVPEGIQIIQHQLFLHTKTEGLLTQFFTSIGHRKHGEKTNMNWSKVPGSKGRCKVYINKWTNDKGETKENNRISKFYDPGDQPSQGAAFTPGSF